MESPAIANPRPGLRRALARERPTAENTIPSTDKTKSRIGTQKNTTAHRASVNPATARPFDVLPVPNIGCLITRPSVTHRDVLPVPAALGTGVTLSAIDFIGVSTKATCRLAGMECRRNRIHRARRKVGRACLYCALHPGPLDSRAGSGYPGWRYGDVVKPGVHAGLSSRRSRVQIPSSPPRGPTSRRRSS